MTITDSAIPLWSILSNFFMQSFPFHLKILKREFIDLIVLLCLICKNVMTLYLVDKQQYRERSNCTFQEVRGYKRQATIYTGFNARRRRRVPVLRFLSISENCRGFQEYTFTLTTTDETTVQFPSSRDLTQSETRGSTTASLIKWETPQ